MFLEAMVVDLLYGSHVVFRLVPILNNMDMYGSMIVRIEHEPKAEKDEYCWHNFFLLQSYVFLPNNARKKESFYLIFINNMSYLSEKSIFVLKKWHRATFLSTSHLNKRCAHGSPMDGTARGHTLYVMDLDSRG